MLVYTTIYILRYGALHLSVLQPWIFCLFHLYLFTQCSDVTNFDQQMEVLAMIMWSRAGHGPLNVIYLLGSTSDEGDGFFTFFHKINLCLWVNVK